MPIFARVPAESSQLSSAAPVSRLVWLQNEKRQLQTALVVEQRVKGKGHRPNDSFTEKQSNRSEFDSDTVSDDAEAESAAHGADSDDEAFVDCEPMSSSALEDAEAAASVQPQRHAPAWTNLLLWSS